LRLRRSPVSRDLPPVCGRGLWRRSLLGPAAPAACLHVGIVAGLLRWQLLPPVTPRDGRSEGGRGASARRACPLLLRAPEGGRPWDSWAVPALPFVEVLHPAERAGSGLVWGRSARGWHDVGPDNGRTRAAGPRPG